jgi:hypothetical protein
MQIPAHGVFGLWEKSACGDRDVGARSCGSGLLRIPDHGVVRYAPLKLCDLRAEGREDRAGSQQGAVYQEVRKQSGAGVRERGDAESGAVIRVTGEYGASHRSALSGTLGGKAAQGPAKASGRGRNLPGEESPVHHRCEQLGTGEPLWFGRERKKETLDECRPPSPRRPRV